MDKTTIIAEIVRTARENGGIPLGIGRFEQATGIRRADWHGKLWARWGDAVAEAGFKPNTLTQPHGEENLLRFVALLTKELGHIPTSAEIRLKEHRDASFPSHTTIDRLGSKRELVAKLQAYCEGREEFTDAQPMFAAFLEASRSGRSHISGDKSRPEPAIGFVYLIKSGRYFKIGRSNAAGRRERELALQLPEKASTVHIIKTDDPSGIEAYWHKRFEAQRLNGEWFDLSAAEVQAFKRRKFM